MSIWFHPKKLILSTSIYNVKFNIIFIERYLTPLFNTEYSFLPLIHNKSSVYVLVYIQRENVSANVKSLILSWRVIYFYPFGNKQFLVEYSYLRVLLPGLTDNACLWGPRKDSLGRRVSFYSSHLKIIEILSN